MTETARSTPSAKRMPKRTLITLSVVYGLLGPVSAFAKMGTVPLLLIGLLSFRSQKELVDVTKASLKTPFALTCFVLMLWCMISLAWANEPHPLTLLRLLGTAVSALLFVSLVSRLHGNEASVVTTIALFATIFLVVVLLIEGITGAYLHGLVRPQDTIPREGEWVPYLEMVAARGTAILAPLCFLVAPRFTVKVRIKYAGLGLVIVAFCVSWLLPMTASSLAILVGFVLLAVAVWNQKAATRVLFLTLICGALCAPLITSYVIKPANFEMLGLNPSREMSQRMAIWDYSTEYVLDRPLIGYGFDASREIGSRGATIPETNWAALPLHPHNAFLQIWLELGLVGIVLTCVILGQVWRSIEREIRNGKRVVEGLAAIGAIATLSLISFGVWQFWWIATWGLLGGIYYLQQRSEAS